MVRICRRCGRIVEAVGDAPIVLVEEVVEQRRGAVVPVTEAEERSSNDDEGPILEQRDGARPHRGHPIVDAVSPMTYPSRNVTTLCRVGPSIGPDRKPRLVLNR